jgi:hypothetical protein
MVVVEDNIHVATCAPTVIQRDSDGNESEASFVSANDSFDSNNTAQSHTTNLAQSPQPSSSDSLPCPFCKKDLKFGSLVKHTQIQHFRVAEEISNNIPALGLFLTRHKRWFCFNCLYSPALTKSCKCQNRSNGSVGFIAGLPYGPHSGTALSAIPAPADNTPIGTSPPSTTMPAETDRLLRLEGVPVLPFIPKRARGLFALALAEALERVCANPADATGYTILSMLPQAILCRTQGSAKVSAALVRERLKRWLTNDDEKLDLFSNRTRKEPGPSRKPNSMAAKQRRCRQLAG